MKKTLTFTAAIAAPRAVVWETMLGAGTYREWTSPFCDGSHYEGSWDLGCRIRFLTPNGDGMVAEIAANRPFERVSIRHLGEIKDGVEDTTSEQVRAWAPAYETYSFARCKQYPRRLDPRPSRGPHRVNGPGLAGENWRFRNAMRKPLQS